MRFFNGKCTKDFFSGPCRVCDGRLALRLLSESVSKHGGPAFASEDTASSLCPSGPYDHLAHNPLSSGSVTNHFICPGTFIVVATIQCHGHRSLDSDDEKSGQLNVTRQAVTRQAVTRQALHGRTSVKEGYALGAGTMTRGTIATSTVSTFDNNAL